MTISAATVRREALAYLLAGLAAHSVVVNRHIGKWEIIAIGAAGGLHVPRLFPQRKKNSIDTKK